MKWAIRLLLWGWVAPNSAIGLFVGTLSLLFGGKAQLVQGCLEFHGPLIRWLLARLPPDGVAAMTLGHTIIGQNKPMLAMCRTHEHVHVRQYERWGPFFLPAYLGCSAYLWWQKRDWYRENPFEVEAYAAEDPTRS